MANPSGSDHSDGQIFPYVVRDVYGTKVLPENLGSICSGPLALVQGAGSARPREGAKANLVVRDGFAAFYFPPVPRPRSSKQTVEGNRSARLHLRRPGVARSRHGRAGSARISRHTPAQDRQATSSSRKAAPPSSSRATRRPGLRSAAWEASDERCGSCPTKAIEAASMSASSSTPSARERSPLTSGQSCGAGQYLSSCRISRICHALDFRARNDALHVGHDCREAAAVDRKRAIPSSVQRPQAVVGPAQQGQLDQRWRDARVQLQSRKSACRALAATASRPRSRARRCAGSA